MDAPDDRNQRAERRIDRRRSELARIIRAAAQTLENDDRMERDVRTAYGFELTEALEQRAHALDLARDSLERIGRA